MNIYAIVPIKHESTRVPGKNYRLMNGKPLFHYILETLSKSKYVSRIYVDTNSDIVMDGIKKHFPDIYIYERPKELWAGNTSTNKLLKNIITDLNLDADFYLQTHATNPLLKTETIDKAIENLINYENTYDSLFSVKTHHTRFYDKNRNEMNHDRFNLIPTQDLDPIYEENSCIYIFPKNTLFDQGGRIGINPILFNMSDIESQDIDWEDDFIITEQIMKSLQK